MSRAKVKTKKIDIDLGELNECFSQLTGEGEPDVSIVFPKYIQIFKQLKQFSQCCETAVELLKKIDDGRHVDITEFTHDVDGLIRSFRDPTNFVVSDYTNLVSNDIIAEILEICSLFKPCYIHLEKTWETVDKKFMNRLAEFKPFTFTDVDFRHIYVIDGDDCDEIRECVFTVLKGMFSSSYEICKIASSPNIDKSKITKIAMDAISRLKPMVPGCAEIFKKIEKSANMFEGNFDNYYKDFIQSGDQSAIFTNFLTDVVKDNENSDLKLLVQCRKLIAFIRKNSVKQGSSDNPQNDAMKEKILSFYDKISSVFDRSGTANSGDEGDELILPEDEEEEDDDELLDIDDVMAQIENPKIKSITIVKK